MGGPIKSKILSHNPTRFSNIDSVKSQMSRTASVETAEQRLARVRKENEERELARETPEERAARSRLNASISRIVKQNDRDVSSVIQSAKISDGKWSKRELNDIGSAISASEIFNRVRPNAGNHRQIAAAAVWGSYFDAIASARRGDDKGLKRQAQHERLAARIVSEGIPRSIVDTYK